MNQCVENLHLLMIVYRTHGYISVKSTRAMHYKEYFYERRAFVRVCECVVCVCVWGGGGISTQHMVYKEKVF